MKSHISLLAVLALLLLLTACGPPLSRVVVHTEPAGGQVKVEETGILVMDGGAVHLAPGVWHLAPYKVPNSPGSVAVRVNGFDEETVVVPLGPEESYSVFRIQTVPAGGQVLVVENNRVVADGGTLSLPRGRYTLRPSLAGYKPRDIILDVKGNTEEDLLIHLGKGYAQVAFSTSPAGAVVLIDGEKYGKTPVTLDVEAGKHQVELVLSGYIRDHREIDLAAGEQTSLKAVLKAVPTSATLEVRTRPAGGKVVIQSRSYKGNPAKIGRLPFGRYTVDGFLQVNGFTRLVGSKVVTLKADKLYRVEVPLNSRQLLFEGKWYPQSRALALEQQRYRSERIARPVAIEVALDGVDEATLLGDATDFGRALHRIMRVGDRVILKRGAQSWTLWKRHAAMTPVFREMVKAFGARQPLHLAWQADPVESTVQVTPRKRVVADIAFALHRSRNLAPLIDLSEDQLAREGETVLRNRADGNLTLVYEAGQAPTLDGAEEIAPGLWVAQVEAGDGPLSLAWTRRPARLLIVSDTEAPFGAAVPSDQLLINEKKIVAVAPGARVQQLVRLSGGPDYEGWKRQVFRATGPLASQLDLSRDEIGPNGHKGIYQRIWLVSYRTSTGPTQRQVRVSYQVAADKKTFDSEKFLRRSGLGARAN